MLVDIVPSSVANSVWICLKMCLPRTQKSYERAHCQLLLMAYSVQERYVMLEASRLDSQDQCLLYLGGHPAKQ